jgi:WD40 repeat protein
LKQTLTGHSDDVWSIAFSPDWKTVASGSQDNTVKLWDAQTGGVKQSLTGHASVARILAGWEDVGERELG